jgi:hypothetical protein
MPVRSFGPLEIVDFAGLPVAVDVRAKMLETLTNPRMIAAVASIHWDELSRERTPVSSGLDARGRGLVIWWVRLPSTRRGSAGARRTCSVIYTIYDDAQGGGAGGELTPICSLRWTPYREQGEVLGAYVDAFSTGDDPIEDPDGATPSARSKENPS